MVAGMSLWWIESGSQSREVESTRSCVSGWLPAAVVNQYPHCACHLSFSFPRFPSRSLYPSQPCSLRGRLCLARCHSLFPTLPSGSPRLSFILSRFNLHFYVFLSCVLFRRCTLFWFCSSLSLSLAFLLSFVYLSIYLSIFIALYFLSRSSYNKVPSPFVYEYVRSIFFLFIRRKRS